MKKIVGMFLVLVSVVSFFSCENEDNTAAEEPSLIIKFKFDPDQVRLNNLGQPAAIPTGHAAQSPDFKKISAHYFELAPTAFTQLGDGTILYHADETTQGGSVAIDFSKAVIVGEGEAFLRIPLSQVAQGNYEYVRVSLAYQEYTISVRNAGNDYLGKLASFVGYNTYITTHSIGNNSFPVNGNRLQGYWAFALNDFPYATSGQAPAGATTVPNPIAATSPIPPGSCVVTRKFAQNLVINGNETRDVVITLSLSTNNSFEWQEVTADGKYEPSIGENVVDMGLRGLIPSYVK
ncbi:hypothetical protein [Flavobacterium lacisediminis]|uniref:DUF1735 domain-containing protein n=1 Tax=Flavobacterium lacisediminis TaxID=2989705 RepID=A0ABT3EER2_9FLAO|nr:hypothetical protein [Flavobacterium lacisediminis]MCW1147066.1 hypothetical protein [Flavobacterium lacisediminis]